MFESLTTKEADELAAILKSSLYKLDQRQFRSLGYASLSIEISNIRGEILDHAIDIWIGELEA